MEIILEPGRVDRNYWRDLWRYRNVFQVLARRDVAVRYKQTVLGVLWALVRPLLTMVVFTVVFGRIAGLPSDGDVPYALMVFAGMLPWVLFSSALSDASNSLLSNTTLISKVYFPRLIVPAATIGVALVDFAIGLGMLIALMGFYRFIPDWHIVLFPVFVLMAVVAAIGPGLWITALVVRYRDFRYVVPFLLQLGLYVSPVGFSSSVVPERWHLLYSLNPLVSVIDGFRWTLLRGQRSMDWQGFIVGWLTVTVFLWFGVRQFRKAERTFADLI
jgi:lipopolysaccharide transport system permease protein